MDPTHPAISIVMPAFNAARTLPSTLASVFSQAGDDVEVVVVDDGSSDDTSALLASLAERERRLRFVRQDNAGTAAARNAAVALSQGALLGLLDADDELLPGYVATMSAFVDAHPDYDIYTCNAWLETADGVRTRYADDPEGRPWVSMTLDDYLRGERYLFAGGALIRRELFDSLGGFRPEYYCEDVDFWGRALAAGARHIFCPEVLVRYNIGGAGQKTTDIAAKIDGTIAVYRDLLENGQLTEAQRALAREAIVRTAELRAMEVGARRLRSRVERLVGPRLAGPALRLIHSVTWIVRPIRGWVARRKAG